MTTPTPTPATPGNVWIVIKNPATPQVFKTQMPLSATVLDLKERLSTEYEGHPSPARMKLIFAGRLLTNEATLESTLCMVCGFLYHYLTIF